MPRAPQRFPLAIAAIAGLGLGLVVMWPRFAVEIGWTEAPDPPVPPGESASPTSSATASVAAPPPSLDVSVSPPDLVLPAASAAPVGPGCPAEMQPVDGMYCPFVAHRCEAFVGSDPTPSGRRRPRDALRRCERYRDELICEGRPTELHFCIDRYEYPNIAGAKPVVMVDYHEAERACEREGKRLCEADEWTLACEGARTLPYPTGLVREPGTCNIDRRPRRPSARALATPAEVSVEIERLDQRMRSGALAGCISPFGALDMSGNVAEWVHDREATGEGMYETSIAGGHYARVPATCRLRDATHAARFYDYRTGFRCCRDAANAVARRLMPSEYRLPKRRKLSQ